MITVSVLSHSSTRLHHAKMAEWIKTQCGVNTLGGPRNSVKMRVLFPPHTVGSRDLHLTSATNYIVHISGTPTAKEFCACSVHGEFDDAFAKLLWLLVNYMIGAIG